jgi:hypothetical protein
VHVVHAIAAARRGGAEQLVLIVGRELQRAGTRITVVFFAEGLFRAAFEAAGINTRVLAGRGVFRPATAIRARAWLSELRPDVVHLHGMRALGHLAPMAYLLGVPVVYGAHAVSSVKDAEYGPLAGGYRRLEGWLSARFAQAVVATSERMAYDLADASGVPSRLDAPGDSPNQCRTGPAGQSCSLGVSYKISTKPSSPFTRIICPV